MPAACEVATPSSCSAAGLRSLRRPSASSTTTPSEMLARTSVQRRRSGPCGAGARVGFKRTGTLQVALAAGVGIVRPVAATVALEVVDHLLEVVARVLAELLAHGPHPARYALGIVLVDAGRAVAQVVEAIVLGAHHGETRHEAHQIGAAAALAHRRDGLGDAEGEHRVLLPASAAAVLVDRHRRGIITPRDKQRSGRAPEQVYGQAAVKAGARWTLRRPRRRLLPRLRREPLLAVGQAGFLPVHDRLEDDVTPPEPVHVGEGPLRVLELQVAAVMGVREKEGAIAAVVGVLDTDHRDAAHADALDQHLLDDPPSLLVGDVTDHQVVTAWLVADEIEVAHEPLLQPAPDERHVAIDLAGLEDQIVAGLARGDALALLRQRIVAAALDVLPHPESDVVRVEPAGDGSHDLVVAHQEFQRSEEHTSEL